MDFIEQLFGIAPDNGDGSLEVIWVVAIFAVVGAVVYYRRRSRAKAR